MDSHTRIPPQKRIICITHYYGLHELFILIIATSKYNVVVSRSTRIPLSLAAARWWMVLEYHCKHSAFIKFESRCLLIKALLQKASCITAQHCRAPTPRRHWNLYGKFAPPAVLWRALHDFTASLHCLVGVITSCAVIIRPAMSFDRLFLPISVLVTFSADQHPPTTTDAIA